MHIVAKTFEIYFLAKISCSIQRFANLVLLFHGEKFFVCLFQFLLITLSEPGFSFMPSLYNCLVILCFDYFGISFSLC